MSNSLLRLHPDAVRVNIKPGARVACCQQHPERMAWWRWEYRGYPHYQCTGCRTGCGCGSKNEDERFERQVVQGRLL